LLNAISKEQKRRLMLERELRDLEMEKEEESEVRVYSINIQEKSAMVEKQINAERIRGSEILKEIEGVKAKNVEEDKRRFELEQKISSLQGDIKLLRGENARAREERMAQKSGESSKITELLKEYEEKIEREIQEKYRVLRDKQKEINNLRDAIPRLKTTINEVEMDKANLQEYYNEEIKKLEDTIADYHRQIMKEEENKKQYSDLHERNNQRANELRQVLSQITNKRDDLLKEKEKSKTHIDQVNYQLLNKQSELEQELKKQETLQSTMNSKRNEMEVLRKEQSNKERYYTEEAEKIKRHINDKTYDNEDLQNKLNIKEVEIDTLNKDIIAWKQVTDNVLIENDSLQKIIEVLEEKNKRLVNSLNVQLESQVKENEERYKSYIRTSQSPMKISKILSAPQHIQYNTQHTPSNTPSILQTHGKLLKALEAYEPEDVEDEGKVLEQIEQIVDPYEKEGNFERSITPERRKTGDEHISVHRLTKKLGVDSPIRKRVAHESLDPIPKQEVLA
jgi:chromosome segregation ATPase